MPKLETVKQLEEYRHRLLTHPDAQASQILVCGGPGCIPMGSEEVAAAFRRELKERGPAVKVLLKESGCQGWCSKAVKVMIRPQEITYQQVTPQDVPEIVAETLIQGKILDRLCYRDPADQTAKAHKSEIPFYQGQQPLILGKMDLIDPTSLDDYLAAGGYRAIQQVLAQMSPEAVIQAVDRSGLRGRGGGGFPTGRKWRFCREASGEVKYLICNADEGEGDPGAFMDRVVMEGNPHAVLEGMVIGGYAIGAHQGFIYVRYEYPLAVKRLSLAIDQARQCGLLGANILGSGFAFEVKISKGAGAFVCGEETALIASMEGKIGEPRNRPPYPAQHGLWGKPTLINNVETLANLPEIINRGADWFAAIGTEKSKGTKVFSLVGAVNHTGLVEVPMGTTLRQIVFDLGGGIRDGGEFKAVQTGGPSGGCIPKEYLDLPVDYDSLQSVGSIMGSGLMIVMDQNSCMVDVARYFMSFLHDESCGKCTPCREGTKQLLEILTEITQGRGQEEYLVLMEELCATMRSASLCGLGQSAVTPVLSTLKYFREEYEAHIQQKKCPALVCRPLLKYTIDPETCTGCLACVLECPAEAIQGEAGEPHELDQELCVKCGMCHAVCKFEAVKVES